MRMVKCDKCDRKAEYTITDEFGKIHRLCEKHMKEFLGVYEGSNHPSLCTINNPCPRCER